MLCLLAQTRDFAAYILVKIRSHQMDSDIDTDLDLYQVMGNRFADFLAGQAAQPYRSDYHGIAYQVAGWYRSQLHLLKDLRVFLVRAHKLRLDAIDRASGADKKPVGGVTTFSEKFSVEAIVDWCPQATPCFECPASIPRQLLCAFLPGASVLQSIVEWCAALRWPPEPDLISGGISTFELVANYVSTRGYPLVVISNKGKQPAEYMDPLCTPEASLFGVSTWDYVRIFEQAVRFVKRHLGLELVPEKWYTTKPFLSFMGYKKRIAGYQTRPILLEQTLRAESLAALVSDTTLVLPGPLPGGAHQTRVKLPEDSLSASDRQKALKHLKYLRSRDAVPISS